MEVPEREQYQYGFHDDVDSIYTTGKGLTEKTIREISQRKNEPEWMLDYRLKAYSHCLKRQMPEWGAHLSAIHFDEITYYKTVSNQSERDWQDVPEKVKERFERLGIPEAERKYLAGAGAQ